MWSLAKIIVVLALMTSPLLAQEPVPVPDPMPQPMPNPEPTAEIKDKSAKDPNINKILGAAEVTPKNGAVIQSVSMKFIKISTGQPQGTSGPAQKDMPGNTWRRNSDINLPRGDYKVVTTVTIRDPLNPAGKVLPAVESGKITIP